MANSIKEALFELTDYSDWDLIGITQEQADALAVQLEESRQEALLEIKRIIEQSAPENHLVSTMGSKDYSYENYVKDGFTDGVNQYHNNLLKALEEV